MALNIALACASSALAADMPAMPATAVAASRAVQILARLPIPDKGCIVFSVITALPPSARFLARPMQRVFDRDQKISHRRQQDSGAASVRVSLTTPRSCWRVARDVRWDGRREQGGRPPR